MKHATPVTGSVTALRSGEKTFYIETEFLVPHKCLVVVAAANVEAACNLAPELISRGKAYGIPDFSERRAVQIVSIVSEAVDDKGGASRIEPVPARYRNARAVAGVTL